MKKKNDLENHSYIIKLPLEGFYESLDNPKSECRTHLICKNLMRKFMKTLREKHKRKSPIISILKFIIQIFNSIR